MNTVIQNSKASSFTGSNSKVSANGIATGIIVKMPAPADSVKMLVLSSLGDLVFEENRNSVEHGLIGFTFGPELLAKVGKEIYYLTVEGYSKNVQVWEQRLGRFRFHNS